MKLIYNSAIMIFIIFSITLSQPKAYLDKHIVDLGTMYNGEKKQGKVILKNIGNDTLRISYVGSSCGCTTVKSPKEAIAPGDSDDIEFEFTPFGNQGKVEKDINIFTNDPVTKTVYVKITANIIEELLKSTTGSNSIYMIEKVTDLKPVSKRLAFKNTSGLPMVIRGDSVSTKSIKVKMDKKNLRPDDTLKVDLSILPVKPGLSNETLYILTDHFINPDVEVKITIFGTQPK